MREVVYRDTVIEVHLGVEDARWRAYFKLRPETKPPARFDLGLYGDSRTEAEQLAIRWGQRIIDRAVNKQA